MSKLANMHDAIAAHVRDGDSVIVEGFTHLIAYSAGHERHPLAFDRATEREQ